MAGAYRSASVVSASAASAADGSAAAAAKRMQPLSARRTLRLFTHSHHCVFPRGLAEPFCAEFRRPLERLEVDVDQSEPVAVAVDPHHVSGCAAVLGYGRSTSRLRSTASAWPPST